MIVDQAVYENGHRRAEPVALEDMYEQCRRDGVFAWIGLHAPTAEEFESVRREFGLHELAVEDAIKAHQRPKLELYGDSLFMVLKTARWIDDEEKDRLRRDPRLRRRGLHHLRPPRRDRAPRRAPADGEQRPELLSQGPSAALLRDRRPRGRRLRAGAGGARQLDSRNRDRCSFAVVATRPAASTS